MLMSLVEELRYGTVFPELAGVRVLISGASSRLGVDMSRAFADHKARILLQTSENSIEMDEVGAMLARSALELQILDDNPLTEENALEFAKGPAQSAFGGLDVVINLIELSASDLVSTATEADIEGLITQKLLSPLLLSRVAANRMRLMLNEGLILNVLCADIGTNPRAATVAATCTAALATTTRKEAERWADSGVRFNCVAPSGASAIIAGTRNTDTDFATEPELAALALYLASDQGEGFTGHVFDAANISLDHVETPAAGKI